jgi:CRP-like cAMP-binding protein
MDIDREKQLKIIAKTNQLLSNTENKRMLLRFQRGVVDLENDRFAILRNSEFVETLIEYLYTLYHKGPDGNIIKILEKIALCACNADKELRERAIFILSVFIEKVSKENNPPEFLEAVSRLLVNWLQIETEYLAGFPLICVQLQTLLQKMLGMGLWYQTENLIIVLSQIQKGIIQKSNLIRKTISKVHASLAEEPFLKNLVDVYLNKKEDRRDIAQCLLLQFGSKAAAVLVQSLIDCKDKEKRFSLIEFIPTTGKVALPFCDYCLKQNPPWYVVRNLIIIISRMEDPMLYEMVRPYLTHKDIRVQLQVLNCITKLGGGNMRDRLIEALTYINDELKQQVVVQLGNMGGKDVGNALCTLLEKRGEFAIHVQDELVLTICTKIKFEPSARAIKAIKELVEERIHRFGPGDRILHAAKDALVSMELKHSGNKTYDSLPDSALATPHSSDVFKVPVLSEEEVDNLLKGILPDTEKELPPLPTSATASKENEGLKIAEPTNSPSKQEIINEAEKNLTDPDSAIHFTIWSKLYEEMTTEEFTAFHAILQLKVYQPSELIVAHGDLEASLFFFDSGTVNLVRNQTGEEVHLSTIGTGDLIGSEIFLTGNAWNLSLYAGEHVRARVFNLEELLKMQVDFPHLAEKIFFFCSGYDVLPTLLRVLDESDTRGSEIVRLERDAKAKSPTDKRLEQGVVLKKLRGGLCFTCPFNTSEKIGTLLENPLRISVRLSTGSLVSVSATIIGTVRYLATHGDLNIFVRFSQPLADFLYSCESIEFL